MSKKPFKIGIVGAGGISRLHLDGISHHRDIVTPVAICDPNVEVLERRADEYSIPQRYPNVEEMVTNSDIDFAIICTPTNVRRSVIEPLIDAGVPLVCEKPFAETYAEAASIEKLSREKGVPIAVDQNFRRHFCFHIAREIIASGRLGRPLHLSQMVHILRRDKGWRLSRERYVMAVMSIHWFDGYRFMLQDEPKTVYCRAVNSPATEGGKDTGVLVTFEFQGGVIANLSESFSSFAGVRSCVLDCERGSLLIDYDRLIEIDEENNAKEHKNKFDKVEATYAILDDLIRSVTEGGEPETSATDNLRSMRMLEAAYLSLECGDVIQVQDVK